MGYGHSAFTPTCALRNTSAFLVDCSELVVTARPLEITNLQTELVRPLFPLACDPGLTQQTGGNQASCHSEDFCLRKF